MRCRTNAGDAPTTQYRLEQDMSWIENTWRKLLHRIGVCSTYKVRDESGYSFWRCKYCDKIYGNL